MRLPISFEYGQRAIVGKMCISSQMAGMGNGESSVKQSLIIEEKSVKYIQPGILVFGTTL
jgi:hypothetical protein